MKTGVVQTVNDGLAITEYRTPCGTLAARDLISEKLKEAAGTGARVEYPFKSSSDCNALLYFIEGSTIGESFEAYGRFVEEIDDGLALPFSALLPAHQLMVNYMGYQTFYTELHDHPQQLGRLIEALAEQGSEVLGLGAQSPAQAIEVGTNYDEQMTPPPIFNEFFAPFYRGARGILESTGKILVVHGDGK